MNADKDHALCCSDKHHLLADWIGALSLFCCSAACDPLSRGDCAPGYSITNRNLCTLLLRLCRRVLMSCSNVTPKKNAQALNLSQALVVPLVGRRQNDAAAVVHRAAWGTHTQRCYLQALLVQLAGRLQNSSAVRQQAASWTCTQRRWRHQPPRDPLQRSGTLALAAAAADGCARSRS